jgi:hypothetical protein
MMPAHQQFPEEARATSVATTARHMADAVGYLRRVAIEAGLPRIAGKLAVVRTNLLNVSAGASEDDDPDRAEDDAGALGPPGGGEGDAERKVS